MIHIFIADDHEVVREGLKRILSEYPDLKVVGEAPDARSLMTQIWTSTADVLLLDITMPGPGFLDLLARLSARRPSLRTLILSVHPEEHFAVRALKAGAAGYVMKDHSSDELAEAIRRVHSGGRFVSPALAEKLVLELQPGGEKAPHERLTDREYQILCKLGSGKSVKQIAEELSLSPKTVSTYRTRIIEKSGLKTNADMIRYVIENQLVG
ncbi:MAG: response regulator transcription factor [Gammaproteobacteria bacterium]|nr:response regulator transcription factor [Gammaproteobacteria bacterium]